jgi:outer membrane murein-binding lipoprotein Lpp
MSRSSKIVVGSLVLATVAVAGYYAVTTFQKKRAIADEAATNIRAELDSLDPMTRAAVVAKLSSDAAKDFKARSN